MQNTLLTEFKRLLISALAVGVLWACQDEKPEIHFPDPIIPQKEFKHVETITPDTLTFNEGDSAVFRMRTIPVNLLSREGVTVQISDTAGAKYPYAQIKSYKLGKDSIWSIVMNMTFGMKSGHAISIMVADEDTVIYSDPTVLNMIPRLAPGSYGMYVTNSESKAGFLKGGQATINLRTTPWDMMFTDSTVVLVDSLGNPLDGKYSVDSLRFEPTDSTWSVLVKPLDNSISNDTLFVRYAAPDTLLTTGPVNILKVNLMLASVKTGKNTSMDFDYESTFSHCFPTQADFSRQRFWFSHNGDKLAVNDSVLTPQKSYVLDARKPLKVTVWKYGARRDYTVHVYNTGLPVVTIDTRGKYVTRRDKWIPDAIMRVQLPDGTLDFEDTLSLKGRGNGTWTESDKKPYALKLNKKAKILGMHKSKRWCLLANYKDRTLLRNDLAFWVSRQTDMPYTVNGRFVELVWNGKHMGNYYLCEQIRIDDDRVNIAKPNLQDPANGGMLILIDDFLDYEPDDNSRDDKSPMVGFRSTGADERYKLPYVLKDPEEDEDGHLLTSTAPAFIHLQQYVTEMEDAIYGLKKNSDNSTVKKYLDYDRAVDYVLIQELTMNHDSYNTFPEAGPHSAYMYKDAGGKLCYGPVWDFDYHTFTLYDDAAQGGSRRRNSRLNQWELLTMDSKGGNKYYFADLVKYDPEFRSLLLERWNEYKVIWKNGFSDYVDMMADSIRLSEGVNKKIWPYGGYIDVNSSYLHYKQNGDWDLSFQEAVNAIKTAFNDRWTWIDNNLKTLGR